MAIGTVSFIRKDGNLTPTSVGNDHISGLIFNLPVETQMPPSIKIGDVIQLFSVNEAIGLGITEFEQEKQLLLRYPLFSHLGVLPYETGWIVVRDVRRLF